MVYIYTFIIQQIVTMPIYGKEALNICHPDHYQQLGQVLFVKTFIKLS